MMLRKTNISSEFIGELEAASMRPQHDAAENLFGAIKDAPAPTGFNEAAA